MTSGANVYKNKRMQMSSSPRDDHRPACRNVTDLRKTFVTRTLVATIVRRFSLLTSTFHSFERAMLATYSLQNAFTVYKSPKANLLYTTLLSSIV